MTDLDPLAHLYADVGDTGEDPVTRRSVSMAELVEGTATTAEPEISDSDVDALVELIEAKLRRGALTDEETVELGLAEPNPLGGGPVLNKTGLRALLKLVERQEALLESIATKGYHLGICIECGSPGDPLVIPFEREVDRDAWAANHRKLPILDSPTGACHRVFEKNP